MVGFGQTKVLDNLYCLLYIVKNDEAYQMMSLLTCHKNSDIVVTVLLLLVGTSLHFSRFNFSRQKDRKTNFFGGQEMTKKIFLLVALIGFGININAYFACNSTDIAFVGEKPDGESFSITSIQTIEDLIVESAGHFLKSHSNVLLILNRVELGDKSGINYVEIQQLAADTLKSLEMAKIKYNQLVTAANNTPYNNSVLEKLYFFDYYGFQRRKNFNPFVFNKVWYFLYYGDIRGIYSYFHSNVVLLYGKIEKIKIALDNSKIPDIESFWRVNQQFSDINLFGQYVSEVFYALE
jgi:hypothetical protein